MEKDKETLKDYLWKDEKKNTSYVVRENKKNAKEAVLDYEVLKYDKEQNLSVLKINLHTGRHHQIRGSYQVECMLYMEIVNIMRGAGNNYMLMGIQAYNCTSNYKRRNDIYRFTRGKRNVEINR